MISGVFLLSSLVVIMTPGPDAALITRTVLRYGRGPALAAAAGMITAGAGHAGLSVFGVVLVLRTEPGLFTAVRWFGAATLLLWGGWTLWESFRHVPAPAPDSAPADRRRYLFLGFLSTALNPKVGLFLVAFLPQFVPPGARPVPTMLVLAAVYLAIGAGWLTVLTELIYQLRQRVFGPVAVRAMQRLTGLLFLGMAVRLIAG
jgi:threonine/homoserine/homoserine lactone efflux protein